MTVRDEITQQLLKDLCARSGIIMSINGDTPELDGFLVSFMRDIFGEYFGFREDDYDGDDDEEGFDEAEMTENILDMVREMSEADLRTMPRDMNLLLSYLGAMGQLPKDIEKKMERVFGKKWRD